MEFYKDDVFVELSNEEKETLSKAEGIVREIEHEMSMLRERPILDLFHENHCTPSYDNHDFIKAYEFLNALAVSDGTELREYGVWRESDYSDEDYERWNEICKYEENRR